LNTICKLMFNKTKSNNRKISFNKINRTLRDGGNS
jgi:hypothetical protein